MTFGACVLHPRYVVKLIIVLENANRYGNKIGWLVAHLI